MKTENSERILRDLYRRLREQDEQNAPSFEHLVSRAERPQPSVRHWSLGLGLAGVAVCVVLVLIALFPHGRSPSDEQFTKILRSAEPITAWEAPTDILLDPPEPTLLRGVPEVGVTFGDMKIDLQQ